MMDAVKYISALIIPVFFLFVIVYGLARRVKVYDSFITGAKESLPTIFKIFPYIVGIFIAIKCFQASGAFDAVKNLLSGAFALAHVPAEVISIALIKPLSGSASTAVFTDMLKTFGPDNITVLTAAIIMGSTETTFYVISVYLGSVGIKNSRYLVAVCLISDLIGIVLAVTIARRFFFNV